jgi:peroxin-10
MGECTICLEQMKNMTATTCGHVFCHSCIQGWLNRHSVCPICRKKLKKKQIYRLYV